MLVLLKSSVLPKGSAAQTAFVGTSCETNAVRKLLFLTPTFREFTREKVDLDYPRWPTQIFTIGLFCNENFPKDGFRRLLEYHKFVPEEVKRVDISEGKMYIETNTKSEISLKDASRFARGGCKFCPDFWNTCAEISIGNTGSGKGWSTAVVRTERADRFLKSAAAAGAIELGEASLAEVKEEQEKAIRDALKQRKKTNKGSFLDTLEDGTWDKFVKESRKKSFSDLEKDIILQGLCILCGACATVCPERNVIIEERPYSLFKCPEECGFCFMVCPRTHSFLKQLSREPLHCYAVRSVPPTDHAQAGGAVTALLLYGIEKGFFENVVVTDAVNAEPISVITNDATEIIKCAGSKYVTVPQVFALTKGR